MARGLESFPTCRLGRLMDQGTLVGSTDAQLLERFVDQGDEAAFEALVTRHGPMVLWVCRSVLRNSHDADDAFQATFLVLARKAKSLWVSETLANWLYRIAVRVACAARSNANARRDHERQAAETLARASTTSSVDPDVMPILCEEITRLPKKYREPVVLCHLEELTHDAAARVLRCPVGTVHGRLSRARGLLRERLARRGLASLTALAVSRLLEGRSVATPIPPALGRSTVQAAIHYVAGNAISSGLAPAASASLATRALGGGTMNLLRKSCLIGLIATLTIGTGLVASGGSKQKGPDPKSAPPRNQPAKAAPIPPDSEAIKGTWVVTRIDQVDHQPTDEERAFFKSGKMTMTIDATRIIFDTDKSWMFYTLDPTHSPRRMMIETSSGKKAIGIYKLEGDDLQFFHGRGTEEDDVPPADFSIKSARPGTSPTLFVLKRKAGVPVPAKDANKKDQAGNLSGDAASLQGSWKLARVEESRADQKSGGLIARIDSMRATSVPDGPTDRIHWTVKDDQLTLADDDERVTASFRLDETRNPKRIDITFKRLKATDDERRQDVIYGIYKIDGDTFTCCFGMPQPNPDLSRIQRPSEFETLSGTGLRVYTLKREQPVPAPPSTSR